METIFTLFALTIIVMATIITIKGKPLEFTLPNWMEWLRKVAEIKF